MHTCKRTRRQKGNGKCKSPRAHTHRHTHTRESNSTSVSRCPHTPAPTSNSRTSTHAHHTCQHPGLPDRMIIHLQRVTAVGESQYALSQFSILCFTQLVTSSVPKSSSSHSCVALIHFAPLTAQYPHPTFGFLLKNVIIFFHQELGAGPGARAVCVRASVFTYVSARLMHRLSRWSSLHAMSFFSRSSHTHARARGCWRLFDHRAHPCTQLTTLREGGFRGARGGGYKVRGEG